VFILEHYFAPKFFAAVRSAFSNSYPEKEEAYKTTVHRTVTRIGKHEMFLSLQQGGGQLSKAVL
jgi:hypothetical protein